MSTKVDDSDRECRLDEAAAEYMRLRSSGQPFDRQQWLDSQSPDLVEELGEFLGDLSHFHAAPLSPQSTDVEPTLGPDSFGACDQTRDSHPSGWGRVPAMVPSSDAGPRYRLQSVLGAGGMGEVWLAEDSIVGRQIAVKKIRNAGHPTNQGIEARFLFESQVMGRLEHPCIVPLHDFGRDDAGDLYSVMKLVNGQSLKQRLKDFHQTKSDDWPNDVEFRRLLEIFQRICYAVAYAHSRGVLHRDIKPDNIMLGKYNEVMLLDWGLAKALGHSEADHNVQPERILDRPVSGNSSATRAGAIMGSPVYMAPEVAAGKSGAVDERTDVYLLGATLYEVLTGKPPRTGTSVLEMVEQAQHSSPPTPRSIDRRIPKPLEAICLRAMALDRDSRYADATALASDIEHQLANEPVSAYREPAAQRALRWCWRRRRGLLRILSGMVLITFAGFASVSAHRAGQLEQREVARQQLAEFRHLADEVQFFAANTDSIGEQTPYFAPQHALHLADQALNLAGVWGRDGRGLPLPNERDRFVNDLHTLLLVSANLYQQSSSTPESQQMAMNLLDQAAALPAGVTRGYHGIRERCLRLLARPSDADREAELAKEMNARKTGLDWFLDGELQRKQSSGFASKVNSIDFSGRWPAESEFIPEAIAAYQRAIQLDPQNYWARYQLARCYLKMQRGPEAVEALGACVALRPDTPWAYSTRGLARGLMGEFELAKEDLERALQVSPGFRPAHLNLGLVAFLDGRDQDALRELESALAPPGSEALLEAAFYRAQVHLRRGDLDTAKIDCERFLVERPNFAPAHLLAANLCFRQGDDAAGMRSINEFLRCVQGQATNSDDAQMRISRARALRTLAVGQDPTTQRRVLELALRECEMVDEQVAHRM